MKKRTKIASLFLAMLMAFSLMAVTASAYDAGHEHDCAVCSEEGIQPRIPAKICYSCQVEMTYVREGDRYKFVCPICKTETTWMDVK